jgi:hypothetical protein
VADVGMLSGNTEVTLPGEAAWSPGLGGVDTISKVQAHSRAKTLS